MDHVSRLLFSALKIQFWLFYIITVTVIYVVNIQVSLKLANVKMKIIDVPNFL